MAVRSGARPLTKDDAFVDTGAWFAYVNAADPEHEPVGEILDGYRGRLVTSAYLFDETVTLTQARLGHRRALQVGRVLLDPTIVSLLHVSPSHERSAWMLFEKRPDKSYSFTDCTSFVLMRELKIGLAIALDGHFAQEGFLVLPEQ